jgi:hypothetical protein
VELCGADGDNDVADEEEAVRWGVAGADDGPGEGLAGPDGDAAGLWGEVELEAGEVLPGVGWGAG